MTRWCECEHPDTDGGRDFGMCQACKRKPHTDCKVCDRKAVAS